MIIQAILAIPVLLISYSLIMQLVVFLGRPNQPIESTIIDFTDAEYLQACWPISSNNCKRIKDFEIARNNTYNCYERNLGITFRYEEITSCLCKPIAMDANKGSGVLEGTLQKSTKSDFGYLMLETGNYTDSPGKHDFCTRIKRYPVSNAWSIICFDKICEKVETKNVNNYIYGKLSNTWSYATYLLFWANYFNESENVVKLNKVLWDIFYLLIVPLLMIAKSLFNKYYIKNKKAIYAKLPLNTDTSDEDDDVDNEESNNLYKNYMQKEVNNLKRQLSDFKKIHETVSNGLTVPSSEQTQIGTLTIGSHNNAVNNDLQNNAPTTIRSSLGENAQTTHCGPGMTLGANGICIPIQRKSKRSRKPDFLNQILSI